MRTKQPEQAIVDFRHWLHPCGRQAKQCINLTHSLRFSWLWAHTSSEYINSRSRTGSYLYDPVVLARPRHKQTLVKQLRSYLPDVVAAVGIPTRIVPHQLRHTYASEMVRAGVGLPALMKLLGHVNPEMTMRYVDVVGTDLQREFHLARSQPRHLAPQPKAPISSPRAGLDGVVDSLLFAQHAIEMFRRSLPGGARKHRLDQLANRLTKILAETRKLDPAG